MSDKVLFSYMDPMLFNQACRSLRRDRMVRVRLVTGRVVEGFPLRHVKADVRDGSLELDTRQGIQQFLSSAIERIESVSDTEA